MNKNRAIKLSAHVLFMMLFPVMIMAQGVYNSGGRIVITSGATFNITGPEGNLLNTSDNGDGSIDLSGTLEVEGDIVNNVLSAGLFTLPGGSGLVILGGTLQQSIGGISSIPLVFNDLIIDNSAGIILAIGLRVNGTIAFNNGLIYPGSSDFVFGPASVISGTPSSASMIVATGSGQVRKELTAPVSFTFPVGNYNIVPEYSPVTLNFTVGTFAPGAAVSLNLADNSFTDPLLAGSYLNRYWNISQSGITGFNCNAVFQYLPDDVTGNENSIYALKINPVPAAAFDPANTSLHQLTVNGLASFGTFTGGPGNRTLNLTLFLEGLYAGGGLMHKAAGSTGFQYPGDVADQILVELHNQADYTVKEFSLGNIDLDTTGNAVANIPVSMGDAYYITVRHKNSIETVSSAPVSFSGASINYDFTSAVTQAFGNNMAGASGVFLIYGGDANHDGLIDLSDMVLIDNLSAGGANGYLPEDVNGDGLIDINDMALIFINSQQAIEKITP